jgi:hypothetical protein
MLAYHNNAKLKKSVVATMAKHRKADNLLQGYAYWKDGKGCAVGCLIEGSDHGEYETRFGIPRILARLEDRIFEGLPVKEARKWPERFLSAIKPGADLSSVWPKVAVFMLNKEHGVLQYAKTDKTRKAIQDVSDLYQRINNGEKIDANKWLEARKNAYAAYDAAADAADAYAAAASYAAADAAPSAADAAAYAAAAYAAAADDAAARSRHYAALATALVRFLGEAEVPKGKKAA